MVYNLVSVKTVIAKVVTDLGLDEENINITDFIEWAGEALEKIGAATALNNKVTGKEGIPLLAIENYQARLPLDFHSMSQIAYTDNVNSTTFSPMKYATGTFEGRHGLTSELASLYDENTTPIGSITTTELIPLVMRLYGLTYDEALAKINTDPNLQSLLEQLIESHYKSDNTSQSGTVNNYQLEYKLVPNYIKTNVKTGYLMVAYFAMPTDIDGYPMIPDNASFKEAIFWYINMKLAYINWIKGSTTKEFYYDAKSTWNFYVKQAYGNAIMPSSLDEMESIKNAWVRLLPNMNAGKNFFKYLDQEEQIKTFS